MKKVFTPQQKAAVALEAIKGAKTISQIASIYEVHPTQVQQWKKVLQENISSVFADKRKRKGKPEQELLDELYRTIGQRDIELGWLKKNCTLSHEKRKELIVRNHADISIARQADLLGISRASIYYAPLPDPEEIRITRAIDELFTQYPFYGSRRMKGALADDYGIHIGRHQTRRLMRLMSLEAIYPREKPQTSISEPLHKKYPYLLRGLPIIHPNQVWGTDITYLRLEEGWAYLVAILDWYSRYVIAWEVSRTLESDFCIKALNRALQKESPEIFNSDQGTQFTSRDFTGILSAGKTKISMDGRGRCMDNIFTERLWRTVKYENVYLKSYRNIEEAKAGLSEYFQFYNHKRRHQSLNYQTPADVYLNQRSNPRQKPKHSGGQETLTIFSPQILSNLSTIAV